MYVGLTIENALQEREKMGDEFPAKYTLSQLLDSDFRLPLPPGPKEKRKQTGQRLKGLFPGKPKKAKKNSETVQGVQLPKSIMDQLVARGYFP